MVVKDLDSLQIIRNELKMNVVQFAKFLGVARPTIYTWEKEGVPESKKPMVRFKLSQHKTYNVDLMTMSQGNSSYYVNKNGQFFEKTNEQLFITVPIVPFTAFEQYLNLSESNVSEFEEFDKMNFPVDNVGKGNYVAFKVSGDSMNGGGINDVPDGSIVLAREIAVDLLKDTLKKAKHGFVILTNTNIMVKDIIEQGEGEITCHSRNESPEFSDFILKLSDVRKIFHIVKRVM
ncbi:Cro/C1-type helix-turn-helix domain [Spirosomataceae bacterium]